MGHAMEKIAGSQLQTYFGLLYGLISFESIIENQPPSKTDKFEKFTQILEWPNGHTIINYLPRVLAPVSTVLFWAKQLRIDDDPCIKLCKHLGYTSVHHIQAELKGFYLFYTKQRYLSNFYLIFI